MIDFVSMTLMTLIFRRRTLKNRGYAASCRVKRLEQKGDLEHEKGKEYEDLDHVQVSSSTRPRYMNALSHCPAEKLLKANFKQARIECTQVVSKTMQFSRKVYVPPLSPR